MSFNSRNYQVLIASPSDLAKEREIAVEAIAEWNAQHANAEGVVLLPVRWETHARPEAGVRPQAAINRQLVNQSDILVGIFWTRIGSNTGVAESGTVEEIDQFVTAGKPALLYFSNRPIAPSEIDVEQHARLNSFKERTYKTALTGSFASHDELRQKLVRDLLSHIREIKKTGNSPAQHSGTDREMTVDTVRHAEPDREYGIRDRIKEALSDKRFKWRTLDALASAAGVSSDDITATMHLLQWTLVSGLVIPPKERFWLDYGHELIALRKAIPDRLILSMAIAGEIGNSMLKSLS